MSQGLRDYDLIRVDENAREAHRLSVTATVGPTTEDMDRYRGVQLTLYTESGTAYARLSEPQVANLIETLQRRTDREDIFEATGWDASRITVFADGSTSDRGDLA